MTPNLFKNLLISMFTIVVLICALEIILRISIEKPPNYVSIKDFFQGSLEGMVIPHPTRGYIYRPNFQGEVKRRNRSISIQTNSFGFRDRPINLQESRLRILAVGDSFTAGWGVESENSWPQLLEILVSSREDLKRPIRVINGGVSGFSLKQIRKLLEESLDELNPQVVIVGLFPRVYWRIIDPYIFFWGTSRSHKRN